MFSAHEDVVAARAYFPTLPIFKSAGELVWLKQPAMPDGGAFNASWEEHVLITPHGPDVEFILHDFDGDNNTEVIELSALAFVQHFYTVF